jgi:DNA-binding NtrC family response regulator
MLSRPVLIAETDSGIRDILPRVLSHHIPQISISTCTSTDELTDKLRCSSYGTILINPVFYEEYSARKYLKGDQILTPLIVMASLSEQSSAYKVLEKDAFDLIVRPIIPQEAAQTVWLALWQNKFLRLLASREQALDRFQQHISAFPHARKVQEELASKLAAYERTLQALNDSIRLLLNRAIADDRPLFDIAASVEEFAKQQALDRFFAMCAKDR